MLSDDAGLHKRIEELTNRNKALQQMFDRAQQKIGTLEHALRGARANEEHWRNLYGKLR